MASTTEDVRNSSRLSVSGALRLGRGRRPSSIRTRRSASARESAARGKDGPASPNVPSKGRGDRASDRRVPAYPAKADLARAPVLGEPIRPRLTERFTTSRPVTRSRSAHRSAMIPLSSNPARRPTRIYGQQNTPIRPAWTVPVRSVQPTWVPMHARAWEPVLVRVQAASFRGSSRQVLMSLMAHVR
jgi:hypothetical protein